jgi:hypothetical protein
VAAGHDRVTQVQCRPSRPVSPLPSDLATHERGLAVSKSPGQRERVDSRPVRSYARASRHRRGSVLGLDDQTYVEDASPVQSDNDPVCTGPTLDSSGQDRRSIRQVVRRSCAPFGPLLITIGAATSSSAVASSPRRSVGSSLCVVTANHLLQGDSARDRSTRCRSRFANVEPDGIYSAGHRLQRSGRYAW